MRELLARSLPNSVTAEQSILGAILLDNRLADQVMHLNGSDFYLGAHAIIFEHMKRLASSNSAIDPITLGESLRGAGSYEQVGGGSFISGLIDSIPRLDNLDQYTKIVKEKATLRQGIEIANAYINEALGEEATLGTLLTLQHNVEHLVETGAKLDAQFEPISETVPRYLHEKDDLLTRKVVPFTPTGYSELDSILGGGWWPEDLIVVAGRPRMGKSSLGLDFAYNGAVQGKEVGVITMEMSKTQMLDRLVAKMTGLDGRKVRSMDLTREEIQLMNAAMVTAAALPIHLEDTRVQPYKELSARVRTLAHKLSNEGKKLDLLVVDQVSFIQVPHHVHERRLAVGEITREQKRLAKELDVPIILLNQIRRGDDECKRPELDEMAESSFVEQDADVVLGVWRPNMKTFIPKNPDGLQLEEAFFVVLKQRNGPADVDISVLFSRTQTTFLEGAS